ncbi:MAG: FIST C-terminal domain-containing protein [Clostridiales Family XIII bacterium]|jgi:hypothetical protein|nr:FIST C-terminal domain-containing protein [Clostridiales Family XIII bacterium]
MIQARTAFTNEIDDVAIAVEEITRQLETAGSYKKHTIGLLNAYAEYVESGVVSALASALPFDIIGTTTLGTWTKDSDILESLTLTVLTSDDVFFQKGLTEPISGEDESIILSAYENAVAEAQASGNVNQEKPALILSYAPLLMNTGGDFFIQAMDKASGGIANFGTVSVDHTPDYSQCRVFYNDKIYTDRYAFMLIFGDIVPKFFVASVSSESILAKTGLVTAASGNQIQTINDNTVSDFLVSLGLTKDENDMIIGTNTYPFIVDYNDGTAPIARVIFAITPEGYAVCGGNIPIGATMSVGTIDKPSVLSTTEAEIRALAATENASVAIIFSCVGRYFTMGYEPQKEAELIHDILGQTNISFNITYSGGEICPMKHNDSDAYANRFHNDSLIACIF